MSYLMTYKGLIEVDYVQPVTGHSPRCPNCDKKRAHYSMYAMITYGQGWVCSECGLYGVPDEEWL